MDAFIREQTIDLGNGNGMTVYQVDYIAVYGNGYDSEHLWRTFGVYERREVAEFVKSCIEIGNISPVMKA